MIMKQIPVRHIQEPHLTDNFTIRRVQDLLKGKDMVQPLHRHAFYFILILENATGSHTIDFVSHKVTSQLGVSASPRTGTRAFATGRQHGISYRIFPSHHGRSHYMPALRNHSGGFRPDANTFKKLHALATSIWQEYTDKQEGYLDVIQANLDIFFIQLGRLARKDSGGQPYDYAQGRLDALSDLLEIAYYPAQKCIVLCRCHESLGLPAQCRYQSYGGKNMLRCY